MNNKILFDFFKSGFYEDFWGWEFNEKESQNIAEKSIKLLEIKSGHILDWCGGWGRISFYLARNDNFEGDDLSFDLPQMIIIAKK